MEELSIQQAADFLCFEGNAQGFRVVTRLEGLFDDGGLRLTCATLGTFLKYPLPSVDASGVPRKKFGFFHADELAVRTVAAEVGLKELPGTGGYARHPLAYLVEAADDICYLIADLEDGIETQILRPDEAEPMLKALVPPTELRTYAKLSDPANRIGYLRAKAIGSLIEQAVEVFARDHDAILDGRRDMKAALLDHVDARDTIKKIKAISRERLYDLPRNLEAEVAGYEVVHGLLAIFVEALMAKTRAGATAKAAPKHELTYKLLGAPDVTDRYRWLLGVTDRVATMTDTDAIELYRRLKGIAMGAAPLRLR
jgi:dGTPase